MELGFLVLGLLLSPSPQRKWNYQTRNRTLILDFARLAAEVLQPREQEGERVLLAGLGEVVAVLLDPVVILVLVAEAVDVGDVERDQVLEIEEESAEHHYLGLCLDPCPA